MQNRIYNAEHLNDYRSPTVPKQNIEQLTDFGKRLAALRKKAGYTQTDLAKELEVSQRMVSYYEGHTEFPPSSLLPKLALLLNVTADELLGLKPIKKSKQPDSRLLRRMQQIEKLSAPKKRQVMQVIDTFIENEQLRAK
jgi:transcriptional regulator with XRE-family HTH domain